METRKIQNKFSIIYKIVNVIFYLYIAFVIILTITFPIVWFAHKVNWWELFSIIFTELQKPWVLLLAISILFFVLTFFLLNIFLLFLLRRITFSMKNWEIFTEENSKNIKLLFVIIATLFIITWLVFSWWIISIVAWLFFWILYEIFFIWFDYKMKNEKLEEENNLTI